MAEEEEAIQKARASCAVPREELKAALTRKEDFEEVLAACARNVKMGPFVATSGLVLEYYLNAATNLLDKTVATACTRMVLDVIRARFRPSAPDATLLVAGIEVAGGIMVGQCATLAAVTHPDMLSWCDFVYCRKSRKSTGTVQQLEGPNHITSRTPESPPWDAVWLDDANSSGSSLRDGVQLMKKDYNINVIGAVYLVDRSRDRTKLPIEKLGMADPSVRPVQALALYDLEEVDVRIARKRPLPA